MTFSIRRSSNSEAAPPCEGCARSGPPPEEVCWGGEVTWTRDIETLEELWAFVRQHGRIILDTEDWRHETLPLLEIYDGYRE